MDEMRLRKLAGVDTALFEELNASIKELDLLEKVYKGKNMSAMDTDTMSVEDIQKRMDAASRAMGLINRLRDPAQRRGHLRRVMTNMNTIRAALAYMAKQGQDEEPAPKEPVPGAVGM